MDCPNDEQLAEIAFGTTEESPAFAHITRCDTCRVKVAYLRSVMQRLAAQHASFDRKHAVARSRLLSSLPDIGPPVRSKTETGVLRRLSRLKGWTIRQRVVAASLGSGAILAMALLIAVVMSLTSPLSAMERMAKRLREVTSFSFELEETSDRITGENRRRIQRNDTNNWRAPASWRGTTKLVKLSLPPIDNDAGELLVNVEEIYTEGQRGILIDHKKTTFFRTRELQADGFPDYSPVNWVQRMSKGAVKVLEDLGTKQLNGKTAHGYVISLGHPEPGSGQNAVHVWVDPETDLPIEFRYEDRYEDDDASDGIETWTNVMRVYNCQWNIDLDAISFEPIAPVGYDDTSWPNDEKTIEGIVQALRLYAEMSGGNYPRVKEFHGEEIHDEMLRLAGFAGPPQPEWNDDERFRQIQDAKAGIDELARVLRNKHHTGYYGMDVGATDKDKILVWWPVDIEDFYFVIYGDLRTDTLPLAEWAKLVPPELAESHMPVKYSKPNE